MADNILERLKNVPGVRYLPDEKKLYDMRIHEFKLFLPSLPGFRFFFVGCFFRSVSRV